MFFTSSIGILFIYKIILSKDHLVPWLFRYKKKTLDVFAILPLVVNMVEVTMVEVIMVEVILVEVILVDVIMVSWNRSSGSPFVNVTLVKVTKVVEVNIVEVTMVDKESVIRRVLWFLEICFPSISTNHDQ